MTWFREALDGCEGDVQKMRFLVRHRSRVEALALMDLRDRWGYELEPYKLAEICDYVVQNSDQPLKDLAESLALAMAIGQVPLVCEDYDTPAEDAYLSEIIQKIHAATTNPRRTH